MVRRRRPGRPEVVELLDIVPTTAPTPAAPPADPGGTPRRRWLAPVLLGAVVVAAGVVVSLGDDEPSARPAPTSTPTSTPTPTPSLDTVPLPSPPDVTADPVLAFRVLGDPPPGFGAPRASDVVPGTSAPAIDAAVLWASGPDPRGAWVLTTLATDPAALPDAAAGTVRARPSGLTATVATGAMATTVVTGDVPGGRAEIVAAGLTDAEVLSVLDGLALDRAAPEGFRSAAGSLPSRVHLVGSSGGAAANAWSPTGEVVYPADGPTSAAIDVLSGPPPSLFQTVLEQFFLVDALPVTVDGQPGFAGTDWLTGSPRVVFDRDHTHVTVSAASIATAPPLTAFAQTLRPATVREWQAALARPR